MTRQFLRQVKFTLYRVLQRFRHDIATIRGKHPVHFLHIGKTGGSAVKYAFKHYPVHRRYVMCLHPHTMRLKHIPRGDRVIFVVRDPISRFVSGFYSRKRQGQPRIFSPWTPDEKMAFEFFSTPNQLAESISSPNTEERERAHAAMRCISHVKSSYWDWFEDRAYFRSRVEDIFFIGFQERLTQDFKILQAKLGMPDHAALPTDNVQAHRNPEDVDKSLTHEAIENLTKWYEKDFEFLDVCRDAIGERSEMGSATKI